MGAEDRSASSASSSCSSSGSGVAGTAAREEGGGGPWWRSVGTKSENDLGRTFVSGGFSSYDDDSTPVSVLVYP